MRTGLGWGWENEGCMRSANYLWGYAIAESKTQGHHYPKASPDPLLPGHPPRRRIDWHPPRALSLAYNLQKHSPKFYLSFQGTTTASPCRVRIPGLPPSTNELRGAGGTPFLASRRPHLPLTSLVAAVAECLGAGPGARPGGSRSRRSSGPSCASQLGAAARPQRPCARPFLAL